jgi:hypothetical protein
MAATDPKRPSRPDSLGVAAWPSRAIVSDITKVKESQDEAPSNNSYCIAPDCLFSGG